MSQGTASKAVRKGALPQNTFEAIYPGVSQVVVIGAGSLQSAALSAGISVVRLIATAACHVAFGANPTAVADGTCLFLAPNVPLLVGVVPATKIAVIQETGAGKLFITEGSAT